MDLILPLILLGAFQIEGIYGGATFSDCGEYYFFLKYNSNVGVHLNQRFSYHDQQQMGCEAVTFSYISLSVILIERNSKIRYKNYSSIKLSTQIILKSFYKCFKKSI